MWARPPDAGGPPVAFPPAQGSPLGYGFLHAPPMGSTAPGLFGPPPSGGLLRAPGPFLPQLQTERSSGTATPCVGVDGSGLVPVEYANSRLWGITSEYENLLNIQRDQHQLALRRSEAEASKLRAGLAALEGDGEVAASAAAHYRSSEAREAAAGLEAKQKELELFAALLRMRDKQIGELQALCESKQEHILRLQGFAGAAGDGIASAELQQRVQQTAAAEVESLRKEKLDLERLVLAKDRQLDAIHAIDPAMGDAPALQLGAQAIQLFHDALRRRQEDAGLSRENQELREELDRLRARVEELEASNAERRGEIKELTSSLTAKMQKVFELETEAESAQHEHRQLSKEASAQLEQLREELAAWQRDCRTAAQLVEELRAELAERDRRHMRHQEEAAQQKSSCLRLQGQVEEMSSQLQQAEDTIVQMLQDNTYKDQLVREMSERMNLSETKLHNLQVRDLLACRQRQLDQGARAAPSRAREQPAPPAQRPLDVAVDFTMAADSWAEVRRGPVASADAWGDSQRAASAAARADPHRSLADAWAACPAAVAEAALPREPLAAPPPPATGLSRSASAVLPAGRSGLLGTLGSSGVFGQTYRPHPGDPVDAAVAEFVNEPRHGASRALFCRLREGSYLYGTQRASLRVRGGRPEALLGSTWLPLEAFVQHMQGTQGVHLQRARAAAAGGCAGAVGGGCGADAGPRLVSSAV